MKAGRAQLGTALAILWMILGAAPSSSAASAGDDFAAGNHAYAAGNYAEARLKYERVLAQGRHANALYNLGNACFRLGDLGHAALEYERALALKPSHPDARANLMLAREKSGARVIEEPWWKRALLALPASTATALALGACWFFQILAGMIAWRRKGGWALWATGFGALLAAGYAAGVCWAEQERAQFVIVISERSEARTEPADRSSVAELLPAGSRVKVLREHGAWRYCLLPGGQKGWVQAAAVESIVPHREPAKIRS